jgi:hypothetical protein
MVRRMQHGPTKRRRLWLAAFAACLMAALCAGIAVHANRDSAPPVVPYDPLPRW